MNSASNNYGALIEKIRKDRKLSREQLCEGIMSKRNYQRFATGEVSISSDKLQLITDKLMLDTYSLEEIYKTDNQDEYQKVKRAFNYVSKWNEIDANLILATIDYDRITSKVNKQLYDITDLLINNKKKSITQSDFYTKVEKLIDYPKILEKKILNAVELSGLFLLMTKQSKIGSTIITDFFDKLLHDKKASSYWLTNEIRTGIYANITKSLYYIKDYEKCVSLCDEGVNLSISSNRYIGLPNMLGHKVLSLNKLGRFSDALDTAIKLYMYILVEGDLNRISFFVNLINTNLKVDIEDILQIKKEG